MLTVSETRDLLGIVVPVHFPEEVPGATISAILERSFAGQDLFCRRDGVVAVVDENSAAHRVLTSAPRDSAFHGLKLEVLARNRGKAGAVAAGLRRLLRDTDRPWLATRDCDGDHLFEDLPRMASLAEQMSGEAGGDQIAVFGARPSWMKPMGWIREEWERLVNLVSVDLTTFLLARQNRTLDRRFWNGYPLDLQAGYRLYNRSAAQTAVECLAETPDDPNVYLMACEILPFPEISLHGGKIGQVQVSTRIGQPVSSYAGLPFGRLYGSLLAWLARRHNVDPDLAVAIFDNHLLDAPAYHSSARPQLLECRAVLNPQAPPPIGPGVL